MRSVHKGLVVAALISAFSPHAPRLGLAADVGAMAFEPQMDEYVVEPGDTLWSISERVVGSPWVWPRVWAYNPEITNPHWIYPGDIIRFYPPSFELPSASGFSVADSAPREDDEVKAERRDDSESMDIEVIGSSSARMSYGRERRFVGMFVTAKELAESGVLTNAAPDKILLQPGDDVYLTFSKGERPSKGQRYMIYRTVREVKHPISDDSWGYITQITGLAQIQRVEGEVAEARLTYGESEVERGHLVTPLRHNPFISPKVVVAARQIEGVVLAVNEMPATIAGTDQVIFVDRGSNDGVQVGNQFDVVTRGDRVTETSKNLPEYTIGSLLVIDIKENAATCLVTAARREIEPGQLVRTRTR